MNSTANTINSIYDLKEIEDILQQNFCIIPQEVTDLDKYKSEYPFYFEVIIMPDGKIYKAIPSHVSFLEYIYAKSINMTIQEMQEWARETLTISEFFNWMGYLIEQTKCVAVWRERFEGNPNPKQLATLKKCKRKGVYLGVAKA